MHEKRFRVAVLTLFTVATVVLLVCRRPISVRAQPADEGLPAPVYNPSPPGILPSDLSSEIARVLRESDVIEGRALARWHSLKPPTLTGQPPVFQDTGTEATETLGEL